MTWLTKELLWKFLEKKRLDIERGHGFILTGLEKKILGKLLDKKTKQIEEGKMIRCGFATSEFKLTLIGGVLIAVLEAFKIDPALQQKIVAIVIAYVTSRMGVKIGEAIANGKK